jgi:NAD(P)-dependent dehydrogenase (short-subunit alcohol dehydrogenase family)
MNLAGKVAVVTGGTRGIGLAIARQLLDHGATTVITGTNLRSVEKTAGELEGTTNGSNVVPMQIDVRKCEDVERSFVGLVERFGGIDMLVNNAGVGTFAPVAEMSIDQWRNVIDTNLTGVFYCCRAALPHLRARGGGWIINISSLAGKNAFPGAAAYCASKAGLNAFSESLMQEVRHDGIRVSYVMPGSVATDFGGRGGEKADWALRADDVAQVVIDLLGHPDRSLPSCVEIRPSQPPKKG